ncbi:MAG TPA: helix-turn-helix domain-containing protein [Dehalococcoidia bacterium]|nr:helix-turn-helix domain-containing protein [Dehalococcoidia bacterium]
MHATILDTALIAADEDERFAMERLDRLMAGAAVHSLSLTGPDGDPVPVPPALLRLLRETAHQLAQGNAVAVVASGKSLTTSQTAALLGVSRPYLVRLLDRGDLPSHRVGSHRRIRLDDLLTYKRAWAARRERALDELTALSDEYGLYDASVAPAHS